MAFMFEMKYPSIDVQKLRIAAKVLLNLLRRGQSCYTHISFEL